LLGGNPSLAHPARLRHQAKDQWRGRSTQQSVMAAYLTSPQHTYIHNEISPLRPEDTHRKKKEEEKISNNKSRQDKNMEVVKLRQDFSVMA
jgi:hypothetical protein